MFPMRDQAFLDEFKSLAKKPVAELQKQANRAASIQTKMDAIKDKEGKDYKQLEADLAKLNAANGGVAPKAALDNWAELNRRIDNLLAGKDMNGKPLPKEAGSYSQYKAVESAARGDGAELHGIRLASFVKVPRQANPTNKTVLRYVRIRTAGKLHLGLDLQGGTEFVVSFDKDQIPENQTADVVRDQILEILRNRLDKSGVTEPEVKSITDTDISIRMPSVDEGDKTGIRSTIKEAAKLQFFLVAQNNETLVSAYNADQNFQNPAGIIRKEIIEERNGEEVSEVIFLEQTPAPVRGEDIKSAFATVNEFGRWSISMSFNDRGTAAFADVTSANIGRRLAIMLDDTVYSAPTINTAITGGSAEITGSFTYEDARRLAGVISSGNLPVSIDITSEFGTEPKLGVDAIRSGVRAGIVGLAVVFVFMIFYYRFCGLVADIALAVNTVLVLGSMALTSATITMPGIAGMVLTVGMAVDANVLIFERIREELNKGKNLPTAVANGFNRAFSAIFDSNLTTIITCIFLYKFGSGAVQGFAVTLAFGVVSSMFTALFMSHAIMDLFVHNNWLKSISMYEFKVFKNLNIDFCKLMKPALCICAAFILLGIVGFCVRINTVFGVDFKGGTQIAYSCDGKDPDVAEVRAYLANKGYDSVNVGYKRGQSGNTELEIVVPQLKQTPADFSAELDKAFPDCKLTQGIIYQVGPSVGSKFRNDSIRAAIFSFLAIVVYLAFRFELMYGVAAVAALIHDVIVAGGIFIVFFQGQLSLTVIAALMTIIGYSINDTIVIFDRIRETQQLRKDLTYSQLINEALNSTLSRTTLTTLTTLFVTICLVCFGGGVIFDFAIVMLFGLLAGIFSTLFMSTAIVRHWHKHSVQDVVAEKQAKMNKA